MSQAPADPTDGGDKPSPTSIPPFPIVQLNVDVLVLIFQAIVDDEALEFRRIPNGHRLVKPRAVSRLALVCKKWKDIVFRSSSLWPVITLDLKQSLEQAQTEYNRQVFRSRNARVDLYLWNIHSHKHVEFGIRHSAEEEATCASRDSEIALAMGGITNLHSLKAHFVNQSALFLLQPTKLPPLGSLHTLNLHVVSHFGNLASTFDIYPLLSHTPRLSKLILSMPENINLELAKPARPLLPHLRILELSGGDIAPKSRDYIVAFLSHSPGIEILRLFLYGSSMEIAPFPTMTLSQLHTIRVDHFDPFVEAFSTGRIKTPALRNFHYKYWSSSYRKQCQQLLSLNPTIRYLRLGALKSARYGEILRIAPNIKYLHLIGSHPGPWLTPLYSTDADSTTATLGPVCSKLLRLTLLIQRNSIDPTIFDELARIRFIAVNESGKTSAGYTAVRTVVLSSVNGCNRVNWTGLMMSSAWKAAEVKKVSESRYELRWPYTPNTEVIVADTVVNPPKDAEKDPE